MAIDGSTEIYGIMGQPVTHSLSPAMHNAAFQALGLNKVYLPFAVEDVAAAVAGFRALGVKGVSVTIPHKQAIISHLDSLDPLAEKIGAVNTLVLNGPHIHGLNTDWLGANRALSEAMDLKGKTVLLLGNGGAARAIGFGLLEAGARLLLASRNQEKGTALAARLGCPWQPLDQVPDITADAMVNATPLGMTPESKLTPVPMAALTGFPVVMDIVYAPLETRLLQEARATGCRVVDGLAMLLYQGVAQFELWTGQPAPIEVMRTILRQRLGPPK